MIVTGSLLFLAASFALFVLVQVRQIGSLDEFTRSVHLTASAIAFSGSLVAIFLFGFLRAEGWFAGVDPRDLPLVLVTIYAASLGLAWRRYR